MFAVYIVISLGPSYPSLLLFTDKHAKKGFSLFQFHHSWGGYATTVSLQTVKLKYQWRLSWHKSMCFPANYIHFMNKEVYYV